MARMVPILRSGFASLTETGLRQPAKSTNATAAALLGKRHLVSDDHYFYHEAINDLFKKTVLDGNMAVMNDIDVQEMILKYAAEAFGTKDIWQWLIFQFTSGSITSLHAAFLTETLNYIAGASRKTNVLQWARLLEANSEQSLIVTPSSSAYKTLSELRMKNAVPQRLAPLLTQWVRRGKGYYDLICCLQVIFGNRYLLQTESI